MLRPVNHFNLPIDSLRPFPYTTPMPTPTTDQLKAALAIAEQIQKLEEEYAAIMGGKAPAPVPTVIKTALVPTIRSKRKPFSAATKAKMAASAIARWAKKNGR